MRNISQNLCVEFNNVCFDYGDCSHFKLSDLSFCLRGGLLQCIVGKNGAGKSTLMKLLLGLVEPTKGSLRIMRHNRWMVLDSTLCSKVFYPIFQNPENQIVATTVFDDVAFVPENRAMTRPEMIKLVRSSIERAGLAGYEHVNPQMLSGGQKQRLAIAGALAAECEFLILDEPTAMLDPLARMQLLKFLRDLSEIGVGIILITHIIDEILDSDVVHCLDQGKIQTYYGSAEFLASDYYKASGLIASCSALISGLEGYD